MGKKKSLLEQDDKMYIFQVKALRNTNNAQLKVNGYVTEGSNFPDEKLEFGKNMMADGNKALQIMDDVYIMLYKCNLTDAYVVSHKKLPVMYASIMYQRPFTTGYLFTINVVFEIETDTEKIKTVKQLLSMNLEGKYYMEIQMDDKTEVIPLDDFPGYDEMVDNLITIIKDDAMKEIIIVQLKARDEDRKKRLGGMTDYSVPEPKYNFSEKVKMYENGIPLEEIIKTIK